MKKIAKYIFTLIITLFTLINITNAKSNESELIQYSDKLKIEKRLNGTAFLAGNEVKVNEKINGIGFVLGEEIKINSEQDYMFLLGMDVEVDDNINKDIFILGENIKLNKDIKRDAYVAGTTIVLNGNIKRNTYVYATTLEIKGNIQGNLYINASNIKISDKAIINGKLKYNDNAIIEGLDKDITTETYSIKNNYSIGEYIYSFISGYIGIVIVGLVLVYFLEKIFKNSIKEVKNKKELGSLLVKGLIILISVPIISLTLLMTGIFTSLSILILILYGILIYISEIFTSYILAYYIDKKYIKKNLNNYLLIIMGMFIIRIGTILPIIGGLISTLSLLFGLGILGNMLLKVKK